MGEEHTIQLSLQLPAGTLEGLTRLVEQLRYLAAAVSGGQVPATFLESGEDPSFDLELPRDTDREDGTIAGNGLTAPTAEAAVTLPGRQEAVKAPAAEGNAFSSLETPTAVGSPISGRPEDADGPRHRIARDTATDMPDGPLGPRSLSKSLRRDVRRYDGGFPLY